MKKLQVILPLLLIILVMRHQLIAQTSSKPILLNKSALSGIGLEKVELKTEPERAFFQKRLLRGEDISIYVVSSESWTTRMDNFAIDEVVLMLNGKARITPENGSEIEFQSNEFFFIPKGYTGKWQIQAGDYYHYELSVISTERAADSVTAEKLPILLDRNLLSGAEIKLNPSGYYEETLKKGVELTVLLKAEKPGELTISTPAQEQLVHILSGQVTITDTSNSKTTFYTGDFFLIPKGFTGVWESQGHGLFKSLIIQKTI